MNIKFGMDNFYVKYLKRFLNHEMEQSNTVLGKFDRNDLDLLIKYLNLPNVKDMFTVQKEITEEFSELNSLFNVKLGDNEIFWTSKIINKQASEFIIKNIDKLREFCINSGWELYDVSEWVDLGKDINNDNQINEEDRQFVYNIVYNNITFTEQEYLKCDLNLDGIVDEKDIAIIDEYLDKGKLKIHIKQSHRKNYFPNKDMLVFINQFKGAFMYNYAIRNGKEIDDVPHYDNTGLNKIALYECKPGQKVTIAHNNNQTTHLIIGCSPAHLKQDLNAFMLQNVVEIDLGVGEGYSYTCSSAKDGTGYNANWLCIQCPSNYGSLSGDREVTDLIDVGDINQDGRIDMQDYHLLARYTATGPGSEELKWKPTSRQYVAMDINNDNIIDNKDTKILYNFIQGDPTYPSLGLAPYTYTISGDYNLGDNVSNLLIIDGHYDRSVNIPFADFIKDDWVIHEKFFNYLLGMAIHPYSNSEDITYLQKLLKEIYPEHIYDKSFFYPGVFSENMRNILYDYQRSIVHYIIGDLNRDNKISKSDLTMLRDYLDDPDVQDLNLIQAYLDNKVEITEADQARLDRNIDGIVNYKDKDIIEDIVNHKYSATFRSRIDINSDSFVNEIDYKLLEDEVNGKTTNLKLYDIPFILGYYDVQTENLIESSINYNEMISEVSK